MGQVDNRHPALAYATKPNIVAPVSAAGKEALEARAASEAATANPPQPSTYVSSGDDTTRTSVIKRALD